MGRRQFGQKALGDVLIRLSAAFCPDLEKGKRQINLCNAEPDHG
jgi:hypothetical protein